MSIISKKIITNLAARAAVFSSSSCSLLRRLLVSACRICYQKKNVFCQIRIFFYIPEGQSEKFIGYLASHVLSMLS
jgi:hypothetical protein